MGQLAAEYRITDINLNLRKQFIKLSKKDIRTLKSLSGWAERVAPKIAHEFYEFQFAFAPTRAFFEQMAKKKGLSLQQLRQALEKAQGGYFYEVFSEAKAGGQYGTAYFEKRLKVGMIHNVINLPPKWYMGSYALYMDLARKYLRQSFFYRPLWRARAERAIFTVFNYDMQAVVDSFLLDLYASYGIDLSTIQLEDTKQDLTDNFSAFKEIVGSSIRGMVDASRHLDLASSEVSNASDQLSESVQEQAAALEETTALLREIANSVKMNATSAKQASKLATNSEDEEEADKNNNSAVSSMQEITQSAAKMNEIITVIDGIAFQTNLLALNAAVEAARAGEQGRGFAVVAAEVRVLAQRSAEAAKEIKGLILDSSSKVKEGSDFVQQLAEMIAKISTASDGQSNSVEQVSTSVEQMSQSTQISAGQAEELTAMAKLMAGQAVNLKALSQQFKLDQMDSAASGVPDSQRDERAA